MVNITSLISNGDGTYNIGFSQPVTASLGNFEPSLLLFSDDFDSWNSVQLVSQPDDSTIVVQNTAMYVDCSSVAMLAQPGFVTASASFATATPIYPGSPATNGISIGNGLRVG